jgi:hypothetical protein
VCYTRWKVEEAAWRSVGGTVTGTPIIVRFLVLSVLFTLGLLVVPVVWAVPITRKRLTPDGFRSFWTGVALAAGGTLIAVINPAAFVGWVMAVSGVGVALFSLTKAREPTGEESPSKPLEQARDDVEASKMQSEGSGPASATADFPLLTYSVDTPVSPRRKRIPEDRHPE